MENLKNLNFQTIWVIFCTLRSTLIYVKLRLLKYSSCRKVPGFLFLPTGLHLCLSHRDSRLQRQSGRVQSPWRRGWCSFGLPHRSLYAQLQVVACSVDSHFTHLAWMATPRTEGGLGKLDIPLLSDLTHTISKDYGVYLEENGHTLRGLFIIDPAGTLRCRL